MASRAKRLKPKVGIVMGSASDAPVMEEAAAALRELGVPYEVTVASAHRSPDRVREYASSAVRRGIAVLIAGAGGAAHLAGALASHTVLPVIGVPVDSSPLQGLDALLSTAQMPREVPVATMAIGKAGARNAGILAAQILGVSDVEIREKLLARRQKIASETAQQARQVASAHSRQRGADR